MNPLPVMTLADIVEPGSLSIEDYGNRRPTKVFIAGRHAGSPVRWHALYCKLRPEIRKKILPNLVNGDVASVQLCRQIGGDLKGRFVAVATPTCLIGSYRLAIVDELGDIELPEPFKTLEDLTR